MDKKGVLVELVGGAKGWVDEWVLAKGDSGAPGFGQWGGGWSKGVWASMVGGGAKGLVREQKKKEGSGQKTSQLLPPQVQLKTFFSLSPFSSNTTLHFK